MIPRTPAFPLGLALFLGLVIPVSGQEPGQADSSMAKATTDVGENKFTDSRPKFERATFGGGCFWCQEAVFERVPGVKSVVSGYAGGSGPRPTYGMVSTGLTEHAEVVQITYDPEIVSFEELLDLFWASHDPTTLNRQGPDVGTQYRSVIFYHDEAQRQAALQSYRAITDAHIFAAPIVTQLVRLRKFYPAERHHQDYFRKNSGEPYCQAEIVPKLMKLQRKIQAMQEKAKAKEAGKPAGERGGVEERPDAAKASRSSTRLRPVGAAVKGETLE